MGGFGFCGLGCGRDFDDRFRGCGCGFGCGGFDGGCGRGCDRDDKRIAVITAVRAIVAKGEGCFDGKFL